MTPLLPALLDTQASKECVSMYGFCKLHTFSQIQIHCLPAANKVVLGVAGSKYQSDTTSLCCEEN